MNQISIYHKMNNSRLYAIGLVQILCLFIFSPLSLGQGYGVKTIVIDPGHGGKDPGATGHKGTKEKDLVLDVALLTGSYIEKNLPDVKVLYTRRDDTFPTLKERCDFANNAKADLFISIHANAVSSTRAYGTETFVLGSNKSENNLRVAQKENSVITLEDNYEEKYEGFDPNSEESYIIFNFMQKGFQEQSIRLATLIQNQYTQRVGREDREVQQGALWVLAATSMPAVLTELGFISNPAEEKFLTSKKGKEYMASAIFRAVREYKNDIDSKQSTAYSSNETEMMNISIENTQKSTSTDKSTPTQQSEVPVYKLQILSSPQIIDSKHTSLQGLETLSFYKDGANYKYTIGSSENLKDIITLKKEYKQRFKGCFPVAFYKGKRIPLSEARKLSPNN